MPASIDFEECIGGDDELPHHCCDADLGWLSGVDELLIFGLEFGVVSAATMAGMRSARLTLARPPKMKLVVDQISDGDT